MGAPQFQVILAAVAASIGYIQTYFIRYPLFVLPLAQRRCGLPIKTWFSLASVAGYWVSKVPAYFVVSALHRDRRLALLFGIVAIMAGGGVMFYAVLPWWGEAIGMFVSGLAGSWAYGIVFQYIEGRQHTEVINAALSMTIVFGGALARTTGTALLSVGVPSAWMPAVAAAIAVGPGCICLWLLDRQPDPTAADHAARVKRKPMPAADRTKFILQFLPGLCLLTALYTLMVAFRSWRDFFASNIYTALLGHEPAAWVFLLADWPGGVVSTLLVGSTVRVRSNRAALLWLHSITFAGGLMMGTAVLLFAVAPQSFPPLVFIAAVGIGLYTAFASLGSFMFERLMAASQTAGTAAFLIFVSDGCGYAGTIALLVRNGLTADHESAHELQQLFVTLTGAMAAAICGFSLLSGIYFAAKLPVIREVGSTDEVTRLLPAVNVAKGELE